MAEIPNLAPNLILLRPIRMALMRQRLAIKPEAELAADREAEIDRLLEEFGGDARAALGAVLHDLDLIVADYEASLSGGYVRRGQPG